MAAYRRVYDSRHLQADCQGPELAPEPYARQSSMGYLYLFTFLYVEQVESQTLADDCALTVKKFVEHTCMGLDS